MGDPQTGSSRLSRRAAIGLLAASMATAMVAGASPASATNGELSRSQLIDLCVTTASDPDRAETVTHFLDEAQILACRLTGRWVVSIPGIDADEDLLEQEFAITAVIGGPADAATVFSYYRGARFTGAELAEIANASGEETA